MYAVSWIVILLALVVPAIVVACASVKSPSEMVRGTYTAVYPQVGECKLAIHHELKYTLTCDGAPKLSGKAAWAQQRLYLVGWFDGIDVLERERALEVYRRMFPAGNVDHSLDSSEPMKVLEVVPWARQLYLVDPGRMAEFCQAVANKEPRAALRGPFFVSNMPERNAGLSHAMPEICQVLSEALRPH